MSLYSPSGYLFIHNPKTGGTTARNLLAGPLVRYLTKPHARAIDVMRWMKDRGAEGHWHLAYKASFIRNPYTWVESMRRHCAADNTHPLHPFAIERFDSWPYWLSNACYKRIDTPQGAICYQRDMVLGLDGEPILNHLARFENYVDEMKSILATIGLPVPNELPNTGLNPEPERVIDGEYRKAIAEYFAQDFELLNYEK